MFFSAIFTKEKGFSNLVCFPNDKILPKWDLLIME